MKSQPGGDNFVEVPISPSTSPSVHQTNYGQPAYNSNMVVGSTTLPQGFHPRSNYLARGTNIAGFYVASNCFIYLLFFGIFFTFSGVMQLAFKASYDRTHKEIFGPSPLAIIGPIFLTVGILFLVVGIVGIISAVRLARKAARANPPQQVVAFQSAPVLSGGYIGPQPGFGQMPGPISSNQGQYPRQQMVYAPSQADSNFAQHNQPSVFTIPPNGTNTMNPDLPPPYPTQHQYS